MSEKIEIPLSKTKIVLLLLGALIFVVVGVFLILEPSTFITSRIRSESIIRIVGIASASFFGLCLIFIARKLFDNKEGLIIDNNGITDNSNATSVGLIEWQDITGVETLQIASTKILLLLTDKPDKYIERAKGSMSKRAMKTNHKMYGTPLSIVATSLKIKFNDLEELIVNELHKRK
ncbi:STM3941 family protein [Aquimarina sp. 2304DJ70-9]|uniref:STM3941 family protein n=1 Tax=Aquimarina penaris TaxID=3231044 RepID=UPI0034624265